MKFDNVIVMGDVHGDYDVITRIFKEYNLTNTAIIIVGDFGIGFVTMRKELRKLELLNNFFIKRNSMLFAVRGNHDNPQYFSGKYDYSNVKLVKDYDVLNINNMNILCIGGAYSIDRVIRSSYKKIIDNTDSDIKVANYWHNEFIVYDEDKLNKLINIDIVITHSAPNFAPPFLKNNLDYWFKMDKNLVDDIDNERKTLSKIYDKLSKNNNLKYWFYGHFHMDNTLNINNTMFIGLGICKFKEIKNGD